MGALTLKSFPFELRGWDIEKFDSVDPTDGFGSSTRVYISKQQIIQIEPDHSDNTTKAWLSDKGRQFFDGITGNLSNENSLLKKDTWQKNIKTLLKVLYLFDHCNTKMKKTYFLTVVFENLGLETLSLLKILEQNYSFLKLRRAEKVQVNNDMEFDFQVNTATNPNQLKSSTMCLLVGTNPRYEGYQLNLDLRQRYLKGNFKCLILGPITDLTFPSTNIGTNLKTLRSIAEGNSFACQDFKAAKNPLLVLSNEISKRTYGTNIVNMVKTFSSASTLHPSWKGLNTLNSTLSEVGIQSIASCTPLLPKDLNTFNSLYFVNVNVQQIPNIKKLTETKLLGFSNQVQVDKVVEQKIYFKNIETPAIPGLFLDQNNLTTNNETFWHNSLKNLSLKYYNFLPTKIFYENEKTFINTEGLIKRTNKLITKKKTREGWKLLRNLAKQLKTTYKPLNIANNSIISFNMSNRNKFTTFVNFHYQAVEKLDSTKPSLTNRNQPFFICKSNDTFKAKAIKLNSTKLKYFIDDFFTGGKDEYSRNSLVLANCSKILRTQSTNFF